MVTKPQGARVEMWQLADLGPYPTQLEYFDDLPDSELKALADDIERNGLRLQLHILPQNDIGLPSGTIISGHQRLRALKLLGRTEAPVRVRYDLAHASRADIDRFFLEDNLIRRQLTTLDRVRAVVRLLEIESGRARAELNDDEALYARDRVAERLEMTGRNLGRYLRILETPIEVQRAFASGMLSLVTAEKIADVDVDARAEIADRLSAGENPRLVVANYLPQLRKERSKSVTLSSRVAVLVRAVSDLDQLLKGKSAADLEAYMPKLDLVHAIVSNIRGMVTSNRPATTLAEKTKNGVVLTKKAPAPRGARQRPNNVGRNIAVPQRRTSCPAGAGRPVPAVNRPRVGQLPRQT